MQRTLTTLDRTPYDLLVIGGGIYGACVAWDAALRGLSVALVEQADFGAATSSNSLKIIHGGLRYLQHADFRRMRESITERRTLMQIAPHLVHPLPVLVPTYGHGLQGPEVFAAALRINDLVSFDRNRLRDPQKHIPRGRVISKQACLQQLPGLDPQGLTGGALFHDAQVYNSERLTLAFLQSAAQVGAALANYVEVTGLQLDDHRVTGVTACDVLHGEHFDIRARTVVNACGPWVPHVQHLLNRPLPAAPLRYAQSMNIVTRPLFDHYAVGIPSRAGYRDADVVANKGKRLLFIAPWRGRSIIGTTQTACPEAAGDVRITEQDVHAFLDEVNQSYPPACLQRDDVTFVHGGHLPLSRLDAQTGDVQLAKHYRLDNHRREGIQGLISVTGVKYTTARQVAERVVDRVFVMRGQKPIRSRSATTPLYGGQIDQWETFVQTETAKHPQGVDDVDLRRLIANYGTAYPNVLKYLDAVPAADAVMRAEVRHAVREEMAQRLSDVILRRTELGTAGAPDAGALRVCAEVMQAELGWSAARREQECQLVHERYTLAQF
ncbi:MAG: glycerol-3-phosphate dehydrogenase/oxidase [Candidatus Tectomicrobia bacterium]|nr:glycerol-3-phosphate dehydrogenase/oxidase [Candidatus Tectomicrobia bacterium]